MSLSSHWPEVDCCAPSHFDCALTRRKWCWPYALNDHCGRCSNIHCIQIQSINDSAYDLFSTLCYFILGVRSYPYCPILSQPLLVHTLSFIFAYPLLSFLLIVVELPRKTNRGWTGARKGMDHSLKLGEANTFVKLLSYMNLCRIYEVIMTSIQWIFQTL